MNTFHNIVSIISFTLNIIGALITTWGTIFCLFEFLRKEILREKETLHLNKAIRLKLGSYLVLAREFFIAGDITKTIISPTWQS